MIAVRHSPVHDALEHLKPRWGKLHDMVVALDSGRPEAEAAGAKTLALCDVSAFPRVTIKGSGAEPWLREQGLSVPATVYDVLHAGDGLIVRTGNAEFFIEGGVSGRIVLGLAKVGNPEVVRVLRQDAAVVLAGARANEVMLETCGVDFAPHEHRMVYSRVAGVSCAILPDEISGIRVFRLWCDGSYGMYFWETMLEIVTDKGGVAAGLASLFREPTGA